MGGMAEVQKEQESVADWTLKPREACGSPKGARNRGGLDVEARQKSGSLITADQALEQNRDVYVVPGRIGDALSEGCLKLIKEGAQVITSPMDIMATKSIEIYYNNRQMTDDKLDSLDSNSIFDDDFKKSGLASPKNMVYSQINLFPVSLETIINNSGISLVEAEGILLELELDGLIEEVSKNYYIRKHI